METSTRVLASVLIVAVIAYVLACLLGLTPSQYNWLASIASSTAWIVNVLVIGVLTILGMYINYESSKRGGWRRD